MLVYEKENKLNIVFDSAVPVEEPDVVLSKEDGQVTMEVSGESSTLPKVTAAEEGYILKVVDGVWTAVDPQG